MSTNYDIRFWCFYSTSGNNHNASSFVETTFVNNLPVWRTVDQLVTDYRSTAFFSLPSNQLTFGGTQLCASSEAAGFVECRESGGSVIFAGAIEFVKFDNQPGAKNNVMIRFRPTQQLVKLK